MKQQVNPVFAVIGIVVVLVILVLIGMKAINPAPSAAKPPVATNKPAEINGHPVPNNVPYDLMQKTPQNQAGGSGMGVAPTQMMNGAQHP